MSQEPKSKPNVFWAFLLERTILGHAVDAVIDVSAISAVKGYTRISIPYQRTDMARNHIVESFLELAKDPGDVLIMLDGDHYHPMDINVRLASYGPDIGVVGALYFRRGPPYDPLFFKKVGDHLRNPAEWEEGLTYKMDAVATGAIAIRRWVFEKLDAAGFPYPYFYYEYPEDHGFSQTEDITFAKNCQSAGILHHCDTSIITPHLAVKMITKDDWDRYREENPEIASKLLKGE